MNIKQNTKVPKAQEVHLEGLLSSSLDCLYQVKSKEIDWYVVKDNFEKKITKISSIYESLDEHFMLEFFSFVKNDFLSSYMTDKKVHHLILALEKVISDKELNFEDYYELQKFGEVSIDLDSFFSGGEILHFK